MKDVRDYMNNYMVPRRDAVYCEVIDKQLFAWPAHINGDGEAEFLYGGLKGYKNYVGFTETSKDLVDRKFLIDLQQCKNIKQVDMIILRNLHIAMMDSLNCLSDILSETKTKDGDLEHREYGKIIKRKNKHIRIHPTKKKGIVIEDHYIITWHVGDDNGMVLRPSVMLCQHDDRTGEKQFFIPPAFVKDKHEQDIHMAPVGKIHPKYTNKVLYRIMYRSSDMENPDIWRIHMQI